MVLDVCPDFSEGVRWLHAWEEEFLRGLRRDVDMLVLRGELRAPRVWRDDGHTQDEVGLHG